jgi:hypothetical protein
VHQRATVAQRVAAEQRLAVDAAALRGSAAQRAVQFRKLGHEGAGEAQRGGDGLTAVREAAALAAYVHLLQSDDVGVQTPQLVHNARQLVTSLDVPGHQAQRVLGRGLGCGAKVGEDDVGQ